METRDNVEIASLTTASANCKVEDGHEDCGSRKPKDAFQAYRLQRRNGISRHDLFLDYELGCSKDLGEEYETCTDDGLADINLGLVLRSRFWRDDIRKTHDGHAQHDNDEGTPLSSRELAMQEEDAEETDPENECASEHLEDGYGYP